MWSSRALQVKCERGTQSGRVTPESMSDDQILCVGVRTPPVTPLVSLTLTSNSGLMAVAQNNKSRYYKNQ